MNRGVGASTNPGHKGLLYEHVYALVDNLTPNILKLQLGSQPWVGWLTTCEYSGSQVQQNYRTRFE